MIPTSEIIQRLVVATVLGAIVGMERERLERAAGLRTHALVGVGAALFISITVRKDGATLVDVEAAVDSVGLRLERMIVEPGHEVNTDNVDLSVTRGSSQAIDSLIDRLRQIPTVQRISSVRLPGGLDQTT